MRAGLAAKEPVRGLTFEHISFYRVALPNPQPTTQVFQTVFFVPGNITKGRITGLTAIGEPWSMWFSASWTLRLRSSGAQEIVTSSALGSVAPGGIVGAAKANSGLRWIPFGDLQNTREVNIEILPNQTIDIVFLDYPVIGLNPIFTLGLYVRLSGEYEGFTTAGGAR